MKVDFNNVRRQVVHEYNDLVKVLNNNINRSIAGTNVRVEVEDIQEILDDLRISIATIALTYKYGDPDVIDVLGDDELEQFNPGGE